MLAASYYSPYGPYNAAFGYFVLYVLWGSLAVAGAHLAVRKGRDLVEGAVLGAFGPLGFLIEVFLPAARTMSASTHALDLRDKDAGGDRPNNQ